MHCLFCAHVFWVLQPVAAHCWYSDHPLRGHRHLLWSTMVHEKALLVSFMSWSFGNSDQSGDFVLPRSLLQPIRPSSISPKETYVHLDYSDHSCGVDRSLFAIEPLVLLHTSSHRTNPKSPDHDSLNSCVMAKQVSTWVSTNIPFSLQGGESDRPKSMLVIQMH